MQLMIKATCPECLAEYVEHIGIEEEDEAFGDHKPMRYNLYRCPKCKHQWKIPQYWSQK